LTLPTSSTIPDYLADDNTAWSVAGGSGGNRILVMSDGRNLFLEQVLRSLPAIQAFQGDVTRPLPAESYDLYIFDGWLPAELPDGDLLIIDPPRSTSLFTLGAETDEVGTIIVQRDDPRMAFVDFGDVSLATFRRITGADWADELIRADGGALLLAGEVDGRQVVILPFDLHDSDLPLQITWPVLMANLMEWFTPRSIITASDGLSVGDSLPIHPPFDATAVRV